MHELSITQNLVAIVEEHAQGQRIKRVTPEIGKLSGVMADTIHFCFEACTENTLLARARLEILEPAGEVTCRRCGLEFSVQQLYKICDCGSASLAIRSRDQLNIKEMKLS